MERVFAAVVVGSLALGQAVVAQAPLAASASVKSENAGNLADVPPLPRGKSTILGGQIRDIDQVRDQFVLRVYGEKPIKILYDGRTQVFLDGNRIPLHEFSPAQHASVQTTLDGSKIFALSVHILSQTPKGDFQGRILNYDAGSGTLTLVASGSQEQFRVQVTKDTAVAREGQSTFTAENRGQSDLVSGALVSLNFQSDKGQGTAQQITILATPGASFVFTGTVSSLNVAGGYMVVVDPRDQRSYQIHFNPQDPVVLRLHAEDHVRVAADYDGTRYVATRITRP
jgi:hypothetical protein